MEFAYREGPVNLSLRKQLMCILTEVFQTSAHKTIAYEAEVQTVRLASLLLYFSFFAPFYFLPLFPLVVVLDE